MQETTQTQGFEKRTIEHDFLDFMQMKEFSKDPLIFKRGDGVYLEDIEGRKFIDGVSGIFVVNVGHNNRRVIEAMKQQLEELTFSPPLHSTNPRALELAKLVSSLTPGDLHTVKFLTGGSEATEAAMKLARQYHRQSGNPHKYKVISRYRSFHGATKGALAASGVTRRKKIYEPYGPGYIHVFPPTCYRCPFGLEYPDCAVQCAKIVENVIREEDPSTVSAFLVEPIGNTGGIITPPQEYFSILREICDKYNVLLIFDEIITGFGRTGEMFASQTFKTTPDILCMGKGMASGYSPIAGIAFRDGIADAFYGKGEDEVEFAHGHTYAGNPLSCAAALASVSEIRDRDLPGNARKMGERIVSRLNELDSECIGEVRGKGLLIGAEFVKNKETKEPFPEEFKFGLRVGKEAIKRGLVLRVDPAWVAFAPPLIANGEQVDSMMDIFADSLKAVISEARK